MPGPDHQSADDAALPLTQSSLRRSTLTGLAWTFTQTFGIRVLSLVTFVILARLLTPYDYGVAAVAGVMASLLGLLATAGFSPAIARVQVLESDMLDAFTWASFGVSALLAVVVVALSDPLAHLFGAPEVVHIMWVVGPSIIAVGAGSVPAGLLQRNLHFRVIARIAVVSNILATVIGIGLAVAGAGYWALVVQSVGTPIIALPLLWRGVDYRPSRRFSWTSLSNGWRDSRGFMAGSFIQIVNEQSDKFIIGGSLGSTVLGIYSVAYRMMYMILDVIASTIGLVVLPSFAKRQPDPERTPRLFLLAWRPLVMVVLPTFAGLAITASAAIPVVFGDQWTRAVAPLQMLCLFGAATTLAGFCMAFMQALGHLRTTVVMSTVFCAGQIVTLLAFVHFGLMAASVVMAVKALVMAPVACWLASRRTGRWALWPLVSAMVAPLIGCAAMVGVVLLIENDVPAHFAFLRLLALVVTGMLAYAATLALVGRAQLRELVVLVRELRAR